MMKDMRKTQMNSQVKRHRAEVCLLRVWGEPPSQHMDVFTYQEALRIPCFGDSYGAFIM